MKKFLVILAMVASASLPVIAASATPPTEPPGQGECEHGNSGQECKPDPQPEHGEDCEEHGPNEGGVNEDHCLSTVPPTTSPPPTTTEPPAPCDEDQDVTIADEDDEDCIPPTTTAPPPTTTVPPCEDEEIVDQDDCPPTTTVPPTTTEPPTTTTPPPPRPTPPCDPSASLGEWYGDPQIDITLEGEGRFQITGGIQRTTDTKVFKLRLDCGETLVIDHYKVKRGHTLYVFVDGFLKFKVVPPVLN